MRWWELLHLVAVFGFLTSHGAAVMMGFGLRAERHARIRALLDLSYFWVGIVHLFMFLIIVTGVVMGFLGRWWGYGWIWASLVILVGVSNPRVPSSLRSWVSGASCSSSG